MFLLSLFVFQLNSDMQSLDETALKQIYTAASNSTIDNFRSGVHILYGENLLQGMGISIALEYQYEVGGMYYGAQLALNYSAGIRFRTRNNSTWGSWTSIT